MLTYLGKNFSVFVYSLMSLIYWGTLWADMTSRLRKRIPAFYRSLLQLIWLLCQHFWHCFALTFMTEFSKGRLIERVEVLYCEKFLFAELLVLHERHTSHAFHISLVSRRVFNTWLWLLYLFMKLQTINKHSMITSRLVPRHLFFLCLDKELLKLSNK